MKSAAFLTCVGAVCRRPGRLVLSAAHTTALALALTLTLPCPVAFSAESESPAPADRVYRNGVVFTAVPGRPTAQAVAIREGRILYVGETRGVLPFVGPNTVDFDLRGRFLMPGLIDGHMHPLSAGHGLLKLSLQYDALTVPELQQRIQGFLDQTAASEPDGWLEVVHWFQESMRPSGVRLTRAVLDGLKTRRPIFILSSYEHTVLANTRALELAGITAATPDPAGGKIWRDDRGNPTGLLEDSAFERLAALLPKHTAEQDVRAAEAALQAMNRQGVTSFLDAAAAPQAMAAFATLQKQGRLTARAHFAPVIEPKQAGDPDAAVQRVLGLVEQYDSGALVPSPATTVRNAKLFLDGVVAAPAFTGSVVDSYFHNAGTSHRPNWVAGTNRGPEVYFAAEALARVLVGLGSAGIDPHLHVDGDGAVRAALDGIASMRSALPGRDIRPALAHDELVHPADMPPFQGAQRHGGTLVSVGPPCRGFPGHQGLSGTRPGSDSRTVGLPRCGRRAHRLWQRLAGGSSGRVVRLAGGRHPSGSGWIPS